LIRLLFWRSTTNKQHWSGRNTLEFCSVLKFISLFKLKENNWKQKLLIFLFLKAESFFYVDIQTRFNCNVNWIKSLFSHHLGWHVRDKFCKTANLFTGYLFLINIFEIIWFKVRTGQCRLHWKLRLNDKISLLHCRQNPIWLKSALLDPISLGCDGRHPSFSNAISTKFKYLCGQCQLMCFPLKIKKRNIKGSSSYIPPKKYILIFILGFVFEKQNCENNPTRFDEKKL